MIKVTGLNNREIVLNDNLIECLESNPDTTITITNGRKYIVRETIDEIIVKIMDYNRKILSEKNNHGLNG